MLFLLGSGDFVCVCVVYVLRVCVQLVQQSVSSSPLLSPLRALVVFYRCGVCVCAVCALCCVFGGGALD